MKKRTAVSKKTRFEVFKRDKFTCQYCGKSAPDVVLEVYHIVPRKEGGEDAILNYVTSCRECNSGKGARRLSDDSVLKKQRAQLRELAEKREQLAMLVEWRKELLGIEEDTLQVAWQAFQDKCEGVCQLNDDCISHLKKLIKRYELKSVLNGIDAVCLQYLTRDKNGRIDFDSVCVAWTKLAAVLRVSKLCEKNPELRDLYYIRGIARRRFSYFNDWQAMKYLKDAFAACGDVDVLREITLESRNWADWHRQLEDLDVGD